MTTLARRLQVLIDDQRYERIASSAANEGVSIGEFVRTAIDDKLEQATKAGKMQDFLDYLDSVEPIDFGTPEESLEEIRRASISRPYWDDDGSA